MTPPDTALPLMPAINLTLPRGQMPVGLRGPEAAASLNQLLVQELAMRLADAERIITEQRDRIDYLETLSTTDELTGLLNRRGFQVAFRRELAGARRGGRGGVLVMVDLDGFKRINDMHSHQAGDAYLRMVARTLADHVRAQDIVARLGGDEFAVLLTRVAPDQGMQRAEALSATLHQMALDWQTHSLPLKASFGCQAYGADDREDEVLHRADVLMYQTKAASKAA
ncbi:GGDEF domain-containing protein [Nitrospirillum viridazoti]|uniref:diguanylate cyclase n=1 Tax=Nitrospirillum amazonense TaxID=28077 RepID=A0A560I5T2_9PROT|nr:GGDEF domain-containing protein [Nitrospirillum amazonense]TWB54307.1 diguanylate cyclase (GGDEF)-like protein [Nitrospirillum amazonense]